MSSAASDPRIHILPPQIANQIAAGEVVERPASVVKELLENSLDAGARSIEVEVEQGGVQCIRIRDDGHGIHRDDLPLALSPHATSKIVTAEDLDGVVSLGFRGEALASIASVSRLVLASRRAGEASGWQIAGHDMAISPVSLQQGSDIEVRDLFYNTPARRKFLRSERTEFSHVEEVIRRIALSRFDLALRFSHNGKPLLRLKPSLPGIRRVNDVLGSAFAENSVAVDVSAGGLRLWGWVGQCGYSRSQADVHYFYLNGRMIRDRLASHAVRLAFGERIPEGRFPAYLLYLELDPRLVDVNVHPTKHEVRFRESRQVHDFIYWAVNGALEERGAAPAEPSVARTYEAVSPIAERYRTSLRPAIGETGGSYAVHAAAPSALSGESLLGRPVCQLHNGYLLAERGATTLLIDLRALLTELHYQRLAAPGGDALLTAQPLLIPESLQLTESSARLWGERASALLPFGFESGWLGDTLLVLRKVPAVVRSASMTTLMIALQGWLEQRNGCSETTDTALLRLLASHAVPEQLSLHSLSELHGLLREYEALLPRTALRPWREMGVAEWQRVFELFPEAATS